MTPHELRRANDKRDSRHDDICAALLLMWRDVVRFTPGFERERCSDDVFKVSVEHEVGRLYVDVFVGPIQFQKDIARPTPASGTYTSTEKHAWVIEVKTDAEMTRSSAGDVLRQLKLYRASLGMGPGAGVVYHLSVVHESAPSVSALHLYRHEGVSAFTLAPTLDRLVDLLAPDGD